MEGELPPGRIGPAIPIVTTGPPTGGGWGWLRERPQLGGREGADPPPHPALQQSLDPRRGG